MTDQEHVMHQMVNGRCPACVAASGGEAHIVLAGGGGYVIGGGGGGGGANGGGVSSGGATGTGGNSTVRHPMPANVTCRGGGGGNVGDPVEITVTDKQWSNKPTRPLVGPISWRIMPATDGQIIIHFECEKDTDRWWMILHRRRLERLQASW